MTQKTVRRCAHCGHGANKRQGPLHFVEQQNAKYHYGCVGAAQEAQEKAEREAARVRSCPRAFSGGHLFALGEDWCPTCGWSSTLKRVTTRAEHAEGCRRNLQRLAELPAGTALPVEVEVGPTGAPKRVTIHAGSAQTIRPILHQPKLHRGPLASVGAEYEPGNGTRYQLVLVVVPAGFGGAGARHVLVWINAGRSMVVPSTEGMAWTPAVNYIAEKLGCNTADAEAVRAFLASALG